jgi:hypothetical protein
LPRASSAPAFCFPPSPRLELAGHDPDRGVFSRHSSPCCHGRRRFNRQVQEGTTDDQTDCRPPGSSAASRCRVLTLIGSSTGWQVGLALGIAVIAVAAVIVIAIVLLAIRIAWQAKTA